MRVLAGRMRANQHLAFSPDGRKLVCGGNSRGVAMWDITTSDKPTMILQQGHNPFGFHFDAISERLFVPFASGGIWMERGGRETELRFPSEDRPYWPTHPWRPYWPVGMTLAADAAWVVLQHTIGSSATKGVLDRYSLKGEKAGLLAWRIEEVVWAGALVLQTGKDELFGLGGSGSPRTFVTRSITTGDQITTYPFEMNASETVLGWALSPDGERVAFSTESRVRLLGLNTRTETQLPVEPGTIGKAIAWHPGGQLLGVASGDGVKMLDATTLMEVRTLSWGNGRVRSLAFAPDGQTAAATGERGWVTLWDVDV